LTSNPNNAATNVGPISARAQDQEGVRKGARRVKDVVQDREWRRDQESAWTMGMNPEICRDHPEIFVPGSLRATTGPATTHFADQGRRYFLGERARQTTTVRPSGIRMKK
jgi:hypothetical protein